MDKSFFSGHNRTLGTIALVLIIVALGAYAYYTLKQAEYLYTGPVSISVTGEGEVNAVPDLATFTVFVSEKAPEVTAAQSAATAKATAVIDALKAEGVEEKDIKTTDYNLVQNYRYEQPNCVFGTYCPGGESVEDGYVASQSLVVKVRDTAKAGALLGKIGAIDVESVSGLSFTIDDLSALKDEARTAAIADAKEKAKVLARDLNVDLSKMVGFYEEGPSYPYYGYGGNEAKAMNADMSAAPNVPSGEQTTTVRVTLTYQVQ